MLLLIVGWSNAVQDGDGNSNTSHVTINHRIQQSIQGGAKIQIHLMLLLIAQKSSRRRINFNSNTSHVTINQFGIRKMCYSSGNSNTSHVTINRFCRRPQMRLLPIQIHLMLLLINWKPRFCTIIIYSNTSHVTINHC